MTIIAWGLIFAGPIAAISHPCVAAQSLVFIYSGPCNASGEQGFATPLVYVKDKRIVEAPEGFIQKSAGGALSPIPEFRRDKKYYLYWSDGRPGGSVQFLETVVTDRSYGNVDHSEVVTELTNADESCVSAQGIITDFPLKPPPARPDVSQLTSMAVTLSRAYLAKRAKSAKIRSELAKAIYVRAFALGKGVNIAIAEASYIEETHDRRRGAGFIAVWAVSHERWVPIFERFADEPDWMGVGTPIPGLRSVADLDGDGVAEVIGYDIGCDLVYKYTGQRLKVVAKSCNGYITE